MYPLLVVLSPRAVAEVAKAGVGQAQSQTFSVAEGSLVEIEPVLPGCTCYPPREQMRIGSGEASTTFWVVPVVVGPVMQARVVVRQESTVLAEVPLEMRVVRQSATMFMGGLSLVLPFLLLVLEHFRLDFKSQLEDGFGLYAQLATWVMQSLTPELLTGLLLAGTATLYLWLRPRRREVFWDVNLIGEPGESERLAAPLPPPSLLDRADGEYQAGHPAAALTLYEKALERGNMQASHFFRASLAAFAAGDLGRALGILRQAESALPASEMKGPLWYNMGCFAARLGRFAEALRYLNRAVDAGFDNPQKYKTDPDLSSLRWHAGFKRLVAGLGR
jgi:hypothetical protein